MFFCYTFRIPANIFSHVCLCELEHVVHSLRLVAVVEIVLLINWHSSNTGISYFVFLGSLVILLLFTSLNTEMTMMTVSDPVLDTYNNLRVQYSTLLECPCSNIIIPHKTFISLSPRFHQVCSSDYVTHKWLSLLKKVKIGYNSPDWRNHAYSHFRLLADLCKLSEKTINDGVQRFLSQSFIAPEVLSEVDFSAQFNITLDQFVQSTSEYFDLLIQTVRLLIQIDQPYFGPQTMPHILSPENNPVGTFKRDTAANKDTVKVCIYSHLRIFTFLSTHGLTSSV